MWGGQVRLACGDLTHPIAIEREPLPPEEATVNERKREPRFAADRSWGRSLPRRVRDAGIRRRGVTRAWTRAVGLMFASRSHGLCAVTTPLLGRRADAQAHG